MVVNMVVIVTGSDIAGTTTRLWSAGCLSTLGVAQSSKLSLSTADQLDDRKIKSCNLIGQISLKQQNLFC